MADVARSAIVCTSPRPMAAPLSEASKVSIASLPRKPAEVIKNIASAASLALLPYCDAIVIMSPRMPSTSSRVRPTSDTIFVSEVSKSIAILVAATPTPTIGKVTPRVNDLPMLAMFLPTDCNCVPTAAILPDIDMPCACSFCKSDIARLMSLSL